MMTVVLIFVVDYVIIRYCCHLAILWVAEYSLAVVVVAIVVA
jgi:hypothetical protein